MNHNFFDLCNTGKLDEAKEMYKNIKVNSSDMNYIFRYSCKNNHLHIAKWLYSLGNIKDNTLKDAFKCSCFSGYLNIAQWLYSLSIINIHADNDEAFIFSCYYGSLNVAQWLYSLGGVHIIAKTNAFIWSCSRNHINVIKWLLLIRSGLYDNLVDENLPSLLYEYAFDLGYLPVNNMKPSYVQYKNKIKEQIKEKNEIGNISVFEMDGLVNIIVTYV